MNISLSGIWKLMGNGHSIVGNVPGDVTNDFYLAGKIGDPYYDENYKSSVWITRASWTYERTFTVSLSELDEEAYLVFEGVDTFSEVYLNGILIGKTQNMHLAYRFPVKECLKDGENLLSVKLLSVYDALGEKPQTKYDSIFCENRILIRKAQCHFGWDWAPRFPGYGIYRDVRLVSCKKAALEEVALHTELNGWVNLKLLFGDYFTGKIRVTLYKDGVAVASQEKDISAKRYALNVKVSKPQLWWPNGYGEQNIYTYTVEQIFTDGGVYNKSGSFAFKTVEIDESITDEENRTFAVKVNGKRIFCRGSNWVPAECMTGTLTNEKYFALVKAAKDANFNMLRVWGGGIYESEYFYQCCDEMGIMVWQEFMFACSEIPEDNSDFMQNFTEEAVYQVKRLRSRPCLTVWCGMNEIRGAFDKKTEERYSVYTLHYLLRGITGQLSPDIPYLRTSPYAFADAENDTSEGDCHNNLSELCLFGESFMGFDDAEYDALSEWEELKRRIKNYEYYLPETKSNFGSECAVLGICNYESLVKYTPEQKISLDSAFFEERFLGNPYTYVMPTFFERQRRFAEGMYGTLTSVKDFVKKANMAHSDIMKSEIVYARVNGRSNGILNWMYNDIWPTGTWSVVDYYLSKKPAYYQMKRCFKPMLSEIIRIGNEYALCFANDSDTLAPFSVSVSVETREGEVLNSYAFLDEVEAGASLAVTLPFNGKQGDYLCARGEYAGKPFVTTYYLARYREEEYTPDYEVRITPVGSCAYDVCIHAKTFVQCVNIYAGENAWIEDNCFDIAAGESVTVRVLAEEEPVVVTFADEWNK